MMIHEVSGDILLTKAQAIAHGVAPNDEFQAGLRLALRGKWPGMIEDFRHYVDQCHPRPGEIWEWNGSGVRVFNLMTLEGEHYYDAKATVANVDHCLRRLRYELEKGEIKSIALPRLATGQGHLEWSEVLSLIRSNLGDLKIPVFVYSHYVQDLQAIEPGV
jgi:O-acetyl-ADP-ribose deacetylase (regulator of RNase III)